MIDNIYITNFRRIKKADIELRDGITIITGLNGTGKSTVIEAIIFNLYGKTKSGTKKESIRRATASDDDTTYTSLDFKIKDIHYRCRRYLTQKGSTMATLYSYTDDEYEKLLNQKDKTELDKGLGKEIANSTTGVTTAITELLGVTYDGFCASFIARQKELDSLANLTLENRKKFFLDLLGYSRLDSVKPEINKEIRARQSAVDILTRQSIDVAEIDRQIAEAEDQIAKLSGRILKGNASVESLENELMALTETFMEQQRISDKADSESFEMRREQDTLRENEATVSGLDEAIKKNMKLSQGYDEGSSLSAQLMECKDRINRANTYSTSKREKEQLAGARASKQKIIDDNNAKISALRKKTAKEPDIDTPQQQLAEIKSKIALMKAQIESAKRRATSFRSMISDVENDGMAKCPTCGSDVGSEQGREHLRQELNAALAEQETAERELRDLEIEAKNCETRVADARQHVRSWQTDISKIATLEKENEITYANMNEDDARITELSEYIAAHSSDVLSSAELLDYSEKIEKLTDAVAHEHEMKVAFYAVRTDTQRKEELLKQCNALSASIAQRGKFLREHASIKEQFMATKTSKTAKEATLDKYRSVLTTITSDCSAAQATLESLKKQRIQAKQQAESLSTLLDDIETHIGAREVIEFLREKLPAKIAPKLSAEASSLLSIATNGTYNMIDIDDNYEVFIYTGAEIRSIAMMSGGEQDIISLCIRIAIAKMILETTGIGQQTFILDEIFGSLDDERRNSACDALHNLGNTLSKILCITHIEEIKDMADWTYLVEKDENGDSTVREILNDENIISGITQTILN